MAEFRAEFTGSVRRTPDISSFRFGVPEGFSYLPGQFFMPAPGGPPEVYRRFEEDNHIARGAEGIYMRPSERPGLGWDVEVS